MSDSIQRSGAPITYVPVFEPGDTCGPYYRVVRLIAQGGYGDVYEAIHEVLGRRVALKVMRRQRARDTEVLRARFLTEARAIANINSPYLVKALDAGYSDGKVYIVMELLEGETLLARMHRAVRLPVVAALKYLIDICQGTVAAHQHGLVHRDIKPANIMVVSPQNRAVLLDLGMAKPLGDPPHRITLSVAGTPAYMSPEQLLASLDGVPVDQRTDVYSICTMAYEMLAGRLPFANADGSMPAARVLIERKVNQDPPWLHHIRSEVPQELALEIHRGLSREFPERHESVQELLSRFEHHLADFKRSRFRQTGQVFAALESNLSVRAHSSGLRSGEEQPEDSIEPPSPRSSDTTLVPIGGSGALLQVRDGAGAATLARVPIGSLARAHVETSGGLLRLSAPERVSRSLWLGLAIGGVALGLVQLGGFLARRGASLETHPASPSKLVVPVATAMPPHALPETYSPAAAGSAFTESSPQLVASRTASVPSAAKSIPAFPAAKTRATRQRKSDEDARLESHGLVQPWPDKPITVKGAR